MRRNHEDTLEVALLSVPSDERTSVFSDYDDLTWQRITLTRASNAYKNANYRLVKEHCESVLSKDRNNPEAKFLLGRVALKEKEFVKASGYFEAIKDRQDYSDSPAFKKDCEILFNALMEHARQCLQNAELLSRQTIGECDAVLIHLDEAQLCVSAASKYGRVVELIAKVMGERLTVTQKRGRLSEGSAYDAIKRELTNAHFLPHQTLYQCNQGFEILKVISEKIKAIKFFNKSELVDELTFAAQMFHCASASLKYDLLVVHAPVILRSRPSDLSEKNLTELKTNIAELIALSNQFFRHSNEMGEKHLAEFDANHLKKNQIDGYYMSLQDLDESAEVELTYKMCVRQMSSFPNIGSIAPDASAQWLSGLDRVTKSLAPQANTHIDSKILFDKVIVKAQMLRQKMLNDRTGQLVVSAIDNASHGFAIGNTEKQRISNVLVQALQDDKREDIRNAIIYAEPSDLENHERSVQRTLTHFYGHRRGYFCCPSHVLALPADFENRAKAAIQDNIRCKSPSFRR